MLEMAAGGTELDRLRGIAARLTARVVELRERLGETSMVEQDLQDAESAGAALAAMMEALQSSAPVGLACLDRDLRFMRVNDALAEMNRLPVDDHIARPVAEIIPAFWPQLELPCRRVLETGEPVVNHNVSSDGSAGRTGHWLNSIYPIKSNGTIVGLGVVVVDVSEQFAAEEFRTVVTDTMLEGLYALNGDGRLTYINGAACRMLGWSAEELRERDIDRTIHFQRADGSPLTENECPILGVRREGRPVKHVEDTFVRRDGTRFPVTYSATPLPSDGPGSGVVVVFRDATEERAEQLRAQRELQTLHWLGRVREAIDEDRLVLYSQPIMSLSGGKPAEELLVRMVGRDGQIIPPCAFLPAAEQYGFIAEIDRWVISRAMRIAATDRCVAVNLSAKSVSDRLLEFVQQELVAAGADPSNVIFELTETALLDDIAAGEQFAAGIAEIGCGLALDDFGTGYASLTYLRVLPARYLKIDIEFVRDLAQSETNQHLVRSIVHLARGLDKQTIAEGVENEEVLALLRSFGVDYAQGFHLGRPEPVDPAPPKSQHRQSHPGSPR
ncbi:MAG: EAL domain-containing protein [Solirubrobacteraceae bacterium]